MFFMKRTRKDETILSALKAAYDALAGFNDITENYKTEVALLEEAIKLRENELARLGFSESPPRDHNP